MSEHVSGVALGGGGAARRGAGGGGGGAPFYAPLRRKTSAEIISEARAALTTDMSGASSGAGAGGGGVGGGGVGGGALRAVRTRRPYTPREPQRTLFGERARLRAARPPSAVHLNFLSLEESLEEAAGAGAGGLAALADPHVNARKKPAAVRVLSRASERGGEGWAALPRLPRLSGRTKPLHRRHPAPQHSLTDESKADDDLSRAISISRPLGSHGDATAAAAAHTQDNYITKSLSFDLGVKRRQFAGARSYSSDASPSPAPAPGDIAVKHLSLAVQLPNASCDTHDNLSLLELSEALLERGAGAGRYGGGGAAGAGVDAERTVQLLEALLELLEASCPAPGSRRDLVLRALYSHIDSNDERILVAIARAMLTMRVTGQHLSAACKLVFKIARNDKNDHFFINSNLLELVVEGCGRADPLCEAECCVYGAGALRFVSLEPRLAARAHAAGALHLAALHLKILNNAKADGGRGVSEQSTHALYQLTGALRNLAGPGAGAGGAGAGPGAAGAGAGGEEFVRSGALEELVAALRLHTDRDVLTNVARCLSVLSADAACCAWLCASAAAARAVLRALAACGARAPLAVRLAYTLGNMAAADERAREHISDADGGVDVLLTILESYSSRGRQRDQQRDQTHDEDPDMHLIGSDLGGSDGSNEDVLIKTVRVLANLCLSPRCGRALAGGGAETGAGSGDGAGAGAGAGHAPRAARALLVCLQLADHERHQASGLSEEQGRAGRERREELATAALATLNNITFYRDPPDVTDDPLDPQPGHTDPMDDTLDSLCKETCRWLCGGCDGDGAGGAAACEAVRALGNLSRARRAANMIVTEGALATLEPYLQHGDCGVRCAAAGVLVNVCGAGAGLCVLGAAGGPGAACAGVLCARALCAASARGDAACGALLARALWNAHAHHALPTHAAHAAAAALAAFIDDESVFAPCERDGDSGRDSEGDSDSDRHADHTHLTVKLEAEHPAPACERAQAPSPHQHTGVAESGAGVAACPCAACARLSAWEELVCVALPLLELLEGEGEGAGAGRADAAVGTD